MDISAKEDKSDINRLGHFSGALHTMLSIVRWLDRFFTLTKEERLKAGINLDGEGRGE